MALLIRPPISINRPGPGQLVVPAGLEYRQMYGIDDVKPNVIIDPSLDGTTDFLTQFYATLFPGSSLPSGWDATNAVSAAVSGNSVLVTATGGASEHYLHFQGSSITDGTIVTVQVDVAHNTTNWVEVAEEGASNNNRQWFDIVNHVVGSTTVPGIDKRWATCVDNGDGTTRCTYQFLRVGTGAIQLRLYPTPGDGTSSYTPAGTAEAATFSNLIVSTGGLGQKWDLTNAWTKVLTVAGTHSPDDVGSYAALLTAIGGNTAHYLRYEDTAALTHDGQIYTFSVDALAGDGNFLYMTEAAANNFNGGYFNLATGAIGLMRISSPTLIRSFCRPLGGGWYRCGLSFVYSGDAHVALLIGPAAGTTLSGNYSFAPATPPQSIYVDNVRFSLGVPER